MNAIIFNVANLFVLPFWALMILFPHWDITRKVMQFYIPFVVLAVVYIYFFGLSLEGDSVEALSNPNLTNLSRAFSAETVMAAGWTHYLVMDLFVGRWIYWEGQRTGVWTIHSLILCLFAGPMGVLSHILTGWIQGRFLGETPEKSSAEVI